MPLIKLLRTANTFTDAVTVTCTDGARFPHASTTWTRGCCANMRPVRAPAGCLYT